MDSRGGGEAIAASILGMQLPPRLAQAAAAQAGLFTAAQARGAGLDDRDVSRLLRSGTWTRLRRGVYAESATLPADDEGRHTLQARAVVLGLARPVAISHISGATLQRVSLLRPDYSVVHVTREGSVSARSEAGVHHHVAALPSSHLTKVDGLVTTSAARTVIDIARWGSYEQGLVAMESALYKGLTTHAELREVSEFCTDWPGSRQAGKALAFASSRSETPGETLSRIAFDYFGLPQPQQQVWIIDPLGRVARVDFWWEEFYTIGEFDGRVKYVGEKARDDALVREKYREDWLRDGGPGFFRWGWMEADRKQRSLYDKAVAAFKRGLRSGPRTLRWQLERPY